MASLKKRAIDVYNWFEQRLGLGAPAIEAAEQLAIYYEHRAKQSPRAAEIIRTAISDLRDAQNNGGFEPSRAIKIEARLGRRLLRLERRCAI